MRKFIKLTIAKNNEIEYFNIDHIVYIQPLQNPVIEITKKGFKKYKTEIIGTAIKTTAESSSDRYFIVKEHAEYIVSMINNE